MRGRGLALVMLAVWGSWVAAGQAFLRSDAGLAHLVPDLALLLLVCCVGSFPRQVCLWVALALGLSRVAFSIEPPLAILAGYLGAALLSRWIHDLIDFHNPMVRGITASLASWSFAVWLVLVSSVHSSALTSHPDVTAELAASLAGSVPAALATGFLALACGPALTRLPGLGPLSRRIF